ncbi:hypothetical protein R1sor_019394 [Riccia sorocarpa]|uniref:Uncharacterized protein n=1 Tax=Riccia sorocarpa TaxID=122646 RepID=A0ABD3ICJ2_9MARC
MSTEDGGEELCCEERSETPESTAQHGTYKLSPDEAREALFACQRRSRGERLLQVREQETLHAAKTAGEYRQRRKRESLKLLQKLKDAWQEEQEIRKSVLEFDYFHSCRGIGQSHVIAQHLIERSEALAERKAKEAQLNEIIGNRRFRRAMKEERVGKFEASREKILAECRRDVFKEVSETERRRARSHAYRNKSKSKETEKEEKPKDSCHEVAPERVLKDRAGREKATTASGETEAQVNAWEAAAVHVEFVEKERERKVMLEEFWKRREVERSRNPNNVSL